MAGFRQPCPVSAHCYDTLTERNDQLLSFLGEKHRKKPVLIFGAKGLEDWFARSVGNRKVINVKDENDMYKVSI